MCIALARKDRVLRPGKKISVWRGQKAESLTWAGFARSEILSWWMKRGELVDVPATRFAERSDQDGKIQWEDVPDGQVVRGLITKEGSHELIKVFTRASTPDEIIRFEHDRMPLIEPPLYSAEDIPSEPESQGELFSNSQSGEQGAE